MNHFLFAIILQSCIFVFSSYSSQLISRPQRMKMIETVNLESETQKMDELEKDMLILRAQKSNLSQLKQQYPDISADKLQNLQKQLLGNK